MSEHDDSWMRDQCNFAQFGVKTDRTKRRHRERLANKIRVFARHIERLGVRLISIDDWIEICELDRFWVAIGDQVEMFIFCWQLKGWNEHPFALNPGHHAVEVCRGIKIPQRSRPIITGELTILPSFDWRPNDAIPEDFYA